MRFLGRKVRPAETAATEDATRIISREIEITVEREWISVTATPHTGGSGPAEEKKVDPLAKRE